MFSPLVSIRFSKNPKLENKKVLLRERKRHSTHCVAVASACYSRGGVPRIPPQTWDGVPPWTWDGVTPSTWTWDGVPPYLDLGWGTPLPGPEMGYPPYLDLGWGTPLPGPGMGYQPRPRTEMGYPPYPDLRWGTPPT